MASVRPAARDRTETLALRFLRIESDLLQGLGRDSVITGDEIPNLMNQSQQLGATADGRLRHREVARDFLLVETLREHGLNQLGVAKRINAPTDFILGAGDFTRTGLGDAGIDNRRNRAQLRGLRRLEPTATGDDEHRLILAAFPDRERLRDADRPNGLDELDHRRIIQRELLLAARFPRCANQIRHLELLQFYIFHF